MKNKGILNENVLRVIGSLGHTDKLVISDAGLPVPSCTEKIDLAVVKGVPSFMEVLEPVLKELVVELIYLSKDIVEKNPDMYDNIKKAAKGIEIKLIEHSKFKEVTADAKAVVRTGECTQFSNIILQSGVDF